MKHCTHYDRIRWAGRDAYGCRECQGAARAEKESAAAYELKQINIRWITWDHVEPREPEAF